MARRRKTRRSPVRRASTRRAPARRRGRKGGSEVKMLQFDAITYGAVRGFLSNLIKPVTDMIPLGNIADEVGVGLANYFIAKNTSGMIKKVAMKGLTIENAMLGSEIVRGGFALGGSNGSSPDTFVR